MGNAIQYEWVVWQQTAKGFGGYIDTRNVKMSKRHLVEEGGDRTLCNREIPELGRFGARGRTAAFKEELCQRCASKMERAEFHGQGSWPLYGRRS